MFEQSLLIQNPTNKSWSFLASVTAELVAVSLLILIPLLYGDHLPEFHWQRTVTVGAPPRPIPQPVNVQRASGPARPVFTNAARIPNPVPANRNTPVAGSQPTALEPPPGMLTGDPGPTSLSILGDKFAKPVVSGPPPEVTVQKPKPTPSGPVRVSQGVQMAKLIHQVMPVYPQMAKIAHISGTVQLMGIIGKDGTIRNVQILSGHPWLARAAVDAVMQWTYRPTLLSGEPVEVICPIDVNFTLSQ